MEHSHVLYELRTSELVTRFPNATAELLIYIANGNPGIHAGDLARIRARLPSIPEELQTRLDAAFARAGVQQPSN
jgi:hypothetical protein